jgi:hypothetical protein
MYRAMTLLLATVSTVVLAQQVTITPNYKEADIRQIVEAVGAVTDKNFIIDPRVSAKVTMLSSTPMTPDAFYEAFLSILEVHQLAAMQSGDIIKIIPNATARQYAGPLGTGGAAGADDIVTQVIQVQNVGAAQLVPILRPLIPQFGHLAAHPISFDESICRAMMTSRSCRCSMRRLPRSFAYSPRSPNSRVRTARPSRRAWSPMPGPTAYSSAVTRLTGCACAL